MTHAILYHFADFGGREVNTIADWVIGRYGLWGAIGLKFLTVVVVILACEGAGRVNPRVGARLIWTILALAPLPILVGLVQLAWFAFTPASPHGP